MPWSKTKPAATVLARKSPVPKALNLTGYWLHRNLRGGAERLKIEGAVTNLGAANSGVDYSLGATLDRPATLTPDTTVGLKFKIAHLDEVDYLSDSVVGGFTASHIFSDTLTARAGLEYTWSDVTDDAGQTIFRHLSLPLGVTWDKRDNPLDAMKGFYIDAAATPFLGFSSTGSGAQLKVDARAYRSFGEKRPVTLAGRVQVGAVFGPDLLQTPREYLFYSGGGGTVRGQPYQSLGVPVLGSGLTDYKTGGMTFVGLSTEVRAKVTDTIGIVGFVDAGQIGATDFSGADTDWHAGAGIGLRYATGFGPIRLDVATPVGGDTGDGIQIYVGIGQSF